MKPKLNCVLVIDDDEATNFFNYMIIEKSGCTDHIKVIQTGQDALDYLSNSIRIKNREDDFPCPELIFLDINMPAMNGWEFIEKFRKLEKGQKGKIVMVMLTTSLFPEDVIIAKEVPEISCFENKPLTADKLNSILKKHFPGYLSEKHI